MQATRATILRDKHAGLCSYSSPGLPSRSSLGPPFLKKGPLKLQNAALNFFNKPRVHVQRTSVLQSTNVPFLCPQVFAFLVTDIKSTDATESLALLHKIEMIDIYSNSWRPWDMGWEVEGPGFLTSRTLELGIRQENVTVLRGELHKT